MNKKVIHIPKELQQHLVSIDDIFPYEKNPRRHKPKGIKAIADSIQENGFFNPIVVDQNNIIVAGHGRRLAAMQLKMTKVPVIKVHMTEEEFLTALVSDNKVAEFSKWDNKLLKETMEYLESIQEAELFVPGFEAEDLDKIFGNTYKETLETSADFGDSGNVDVMDEATRVTSMTFKMSVKDHKKVKSTMGAIMRENDFETIGECLVYMASKFKGPGKTIRRKAE